MTSAKSTMGTIAAICTAIVVVMWTLPPADASVPAWVSSDGIILQTPVAVVGGPPSPDALGTGEEASPRRIVQVKKTVLETWALGDGPRAGCGDADDEDDESAARDDRDCRDEPQHGGPPAERGRQFRIILRGDDHQAEAVKPSPCRPDKPICAETCPKAGQPCKEEPRRAKHESGQWKEVNLLLKSYNELIEFYEEQDRPRDKERALRERIDLCQKLAELRMLAEFDGPGAAMQEYYRFTDRPDRAIELDLHAIERELDDLARQQADLDGEMARLAGRREFIEGKLGELNERREQRMEELSELQEQEEADKAQDKDDDEDEENAASGSSHDRNASLSQHVRAVDKALADGSLKGARRARLERRQARIVAAIDRDVWREPSAARPQQARREAGGLLGCGWPERLPASPDVLASPDAFQSGIGGRIEGWIRLKLAEIGRHVRQAHARLALGSRLDESSPVCDQ